MFYEIKSLSVKKKKQNKKIEPRSPSNGRNVEQNNFVTCMPCTVTYWNTAEEAQLIRARDSLCIRGALNRPALSPGVFHPRVLYMHVQSASQPGHEISKTNVNQSGHQTVTGFTATGCPLS